jgi:hypothetical protein
MSHYDEGNETGEPVKTKLRNLYVDYREVENGKVQEREGNDYLSYITDIIVERIGGKIVQFETNIKENEKEKEQINENITILMHKKYE